MAKTNLSSMSIKDLLKLRDEIGSVLSEKAGRLQSQLAALGDSGWITPGSKVRASKLKGQKVAVSRFGSISHFAALNIFQKSGGSP